MKRTPYTATLSTGDSDTVATTYAWNSALRAAEGLVREHARATGEQYARGESVVTDRSGVTVKPGSPGAQYSCVWRGVKTGTAVVVTVEAT